MEDINKPMAISDCCEAPAFEVYTWPKFVKSYKKKFHEIIPTDKEIHICDQCEKMCKVIYKS